MEADIRWRYHLDYRDLSLVELARFVRHLPPDSAIGAIGRDGPHWSLTDYLLDDARMWLMAIAGIEGKRIKPHSQRPAEVKPPDPARLAAFAKQAARIRERKRRARKVAEEGS